MNWKKGLTAAAVVAAAACGAATTRAAVITGFSFEGVIVSATPATTPSVSAGGSGQNINSDSGTVAGTATGLHASTATVYSTPAGNGSIQAFSSNNWAVGDYYQFTTSTTGQTGVQVLLDQTISGTGPAGFKVSYSTNGGSSFLDLAGGTYTPSSAVTFSSGTTNTSTPPRFLISGGGALDNVSNLIIRLVDTVAPTMTGGTSRVDNFTVGTNLVVPEPAGLGLLAVGGLAVLGRRRRA